MGESKYDTYQPNDGRFDFLSLCITVIGVVWSQKKSFGSRQKAVARKFDCLQFKESYYLFYAYIGPFSYGLFWLDVRLFTRELLARYHPISFDLTYLFNLLTYYISIRLFSLFPFLI